MLFFNIVIAIAIVAALYLFCVLPSLKKPDCSRLLGWNYAHRGYHDNKKGAPENSIPAFENAVIMGYGIELDVRTSSDGVMVVHHDATLKRSCSDKRKVSELTAKELAKQRLFGFDVGIPTLKKVLKVIDGQVPVIIEIKDESFKSDTVILLRDILKNYYGAYCIKSFNPIQMMHVRRLMPEAVRGQLSTDFKADEGNCGVLKGFLLGNMLLNFLSRPHFISFGYRFNNKLSFKICKKFCSFTSGWTAKTPAAFERTLKHFDIAIFEGFAPENNKR